ncbi:MAG: KamA family radical SAM protein [Myxococcota bacterium]|nr:KamA family radical SAM protein [Myxococcota bacterium]
MTANVSETSDWKWQLRNQIRTVQQLEQVFPLSEEERTAIIELNSRFRLGMTPYYLSLMDPTDLNCPIRRQAIPLLAEKVISPQEREDPLAEERDMPITGLTSRYPNRALLYLTHTCAVYCRHCTRRRKVGDPESNSKADQITKAVEWLKKNPQINDVILSGGDPLSWSDRRIEDLLDRIRPHVSIVRIGTRHPTTLPQRITAGLANILSKYPPIYVMTHFNHPKECTAEAELALKRLADAGCVLSNQSVLLKEINDDADTLHMLHLWLLKNRCRPYRLFHCDYTEGVGHFRVSLHRGLEIIKSLRGRSSGLALPVSVIDLPGGYGKVPVSEGVMSGGQWVFTNWEGRKVKVVEDY